MTAQRADIERLQVVLITLLGRKVSMNEIRLAMNLKTSTFYNQKDKGRLISLDSVSGVASYFGVSPTALLVEMDLLDERDASEFGSDTPSLRKALQGRSDVPDL